MEYTKFMADRVKTMKGSAIREMFKRMADPEIISLAGGNPASELFPGDELSKIAGKILMTNPTLALQYGTTDGYPKMKDCARKRAEKVNSVGENDEILIMTGANQGIDLTAKAVLNKGDKVIVESPSFIGSLNAFRTYEAELVGVTVEADGMNMNELEETLKNTDGVKMIYTIPTFQNPTGCTMSLEKRKRMLEIASKYDVLILEDNPYGDLRFAGEDVPTIKSLDTEDSYLKNYKKAGKKTYKSVPAVHMKGERLVRGELGIIHGYMSVRQLKEKAKELGMSINEYLSGIFVYSIYKGYLHGNVSKKPIVLCVPVNLRPFFGSMTTRNFFAMASASFLPEKEKYERQEVMKLVQAELKRQITQENLEKMIAYNVSNQKNYALRVVPLFLKKPAIKLVYLMSAKATTTTITNMGRMIVDEAYRPYIKRFQIILSPSTGQNTKATVCSYGDELTFTFSSLLKDTSVQKVFFRSLAEDGIDVEIETNGVYYD